MHKYLLVSFVIAPLISDCSCGQQGGIQDPSPLGYREVPCGENLTADNDDVVCGLVRVPENRIRDTGREIEIFLLRPADAPTDKNPLIVLAGGPGAPHVQFAAARDLPNRMTDLLGREVIYVEQRGLAPSIPNTICGREEDYPACVTRVAGEADPVSYHTLSNAADIAAIPEAIGVEKIDVFAGSYATQLAAKAAARHPESFGTLVLGGVMTPGQYDNSDGFVPDALASGMADFKNRCEEDAACAALLPGIDPAEDLKAIQDKLNSDDAVEIMGIEMESVEQLEQTRQGMHYISQMRNAFTMALYFAARDDTPSFYEHFGEGDANTGKTFSANLLRTTAENVASDDSVMANVTRCFDQAPADGCLAAGVSFLSPKDYADEEFISPEGSELPILMFSGASDPATPTGQLSDYTPLFSNLTQRMFPCLGHDVSRISNMTHGSCMVDTTRAFLDDETLPDCVETACETVPLTPTKSDIVEVVDEYIVGFTGE